MGVDLRCVRSIRWFRAPAVVSRVLGGLLRRSTLRAQGGIPDDGARSRASRVPQLVPPAVPTRLRDVPMRRRRVMLPKLRPRDDPAAFRAEFAADIATSLRR